jgi:c(7)-type cytochrome triheme protein
MGAAVKGGRWIRAGLVALLVCASSAGAPPAASELGDVPYAREEGAEQFPPAFFPHWVHRLRYKCYACHDDIFPMQRGTNPTMAAMARGESCGACHNGRVAFAIDMCQRCHMRP